MAVSHGLKCVEVGDDGGVRETGFVILDTPFVLEYAEAIGGRKDFPDDASLDWLDPLDCDSEVEPADCFEPEPVLESLRWIERTATKKTNENAAFWTQHETKTHRPEGPLAFSPEALSAHCAHDLGGMIRLCEEAVAQRHLIIHVVAP